MAQQPPNLLSYLLIDLRLGLRRWWSIGTRVALLSTIIGAALLIPLLIAAQIREPKPLFDLLAMALLGLFIEAFESLILGTVIATLDLLWRLFGIALLVTALLVPLGFAGILALLGPWLVDLGVTTFTLWAQAIAASPDFVSYDPLSSLGAFGHAGSAVALVFLVLLLPAVVIWVGKAAILLVTPPVLGSLLALIAAVILVLVLAIGLPLLIATPLLLFTMIRRLRRRHREHLATTDAEA